MERSDKENEVKGCRTKDMKEWKNEREGSGVGTKVPNKDRSEQL